MKNKILMIIHDINYGGAAKVFAFLANGLSRIGNDVTVVTYEGSKPNYQLDCSIRYIPERTLHKSKLFRRISPIQRMIRIYDQTKPDIAISFLPNANVYNVVASRVTKTRCIISERSDPYSEQGVLLNSKRFFYRFADGVVFQTEGAKNYYRGRISPLKSEIIPNPIMIDKVSRIAYEDRENMGLCYNSGHDDKIVL
mgnify:CR=1 FL=1